MEEFFMSLSCEIEPFSMKFFHDSCEILASQRRPYCLIKKGQWPNHVISTQLRGNLRSGHQFFTIYSVMHYYFPEEMHPRHFTLAFASTEEIEQVNN
jgi:hypothetical protein